MVRVNTLLPAAEVITAGKGFGATAVGAWA
jgi:hypothetical protein